MSTTYDNTTCDDDGGAQAARKEPKQVPGSGASANVTATGSGESQATKRKGGAPKGNVNRRTHGLRQGGRRLLVIGSTPPNDRWVERILEALRGKWEQSVIEQKGQLSRVDEETIQSAVRWERHALLSSNWLRKSFDKLTPEQRLAHSKEIAEASEKRDRKLRILGIDASTAIDPWAALDNPPPVPSSQKAPTPACDSLAITGANATDAKPGPLNAMPNERET